MTRRRRWPCESWTSSPACAEPRASASRTASRTNWRSSRCTSPRSVSPSSATCVRATRRVWSPSCPTQRSSSSQGADRPSSRLSVPSRSPSACANWCVPARWRWRGCPHPNVATTPNRKERPHVQNVIARLLRCGRRPRAPQRAYGRHHRLREPEARTRLDSVRERRPTARVTAPPTRVLAWVAVEQEASGHALADALAYAAGIGCTRAGVLPTTFREETESDLFGEQVVLCGGVTALITAGFETLVAAGYAPELAYFECLHELKLIVDLMYRGGMKFMRYSISDTAEYGDYTRGPTLITPALRAPTQQIPPPIHRGAFAREWIDESRQGGPTFERLRREPNDHLIERVGAEPRASTARSA